MFPQHGAGLLNIYFAHILKVSRENCLSVHIKCLESFIQPSQHSTQVISNRLFEAVYYGIIYLKRNNLDKRIWNVWLKHSSTCSWIKQPNSNFEIFF